MDPFPKTPRFISNFPWKAKPREYSKYTEVLQLKWYLFSSANHPEVRVRYNFNEKTFKLKFIPHQIFGQQ
jgi:hypothetical protein